MAMPNGKMSAWGLARKRKLERNPVISKYGAARRRTNRGTARSVPKFPFHFADQPLRKFVKLKYVQHMSVAGPAIGAIVIKVFRTNSLYDPDFTLGGHQPYGFDQLMLQYNHYTVLKSIYEIENLNVVNADNVMAVSALVADSGTIQSAYTSASGPDGVLELPIVSQTLSMNTYGADVQGRNRRTRLYFDASKYFGKKAWDLIGDDRFSGDVGHDPAEQAFFEVGFYDALNQDRSTRTYPIKITITYFACLTEPKWFTTS